MSTHAVRYVSTRGRSEPTTISGAIARGPAPDGGLYVPETLPRLDLDGAPVGGTLAQVAAWLLAPFFVGDPLEDALGTITHDALDFQTPLRALPRPGDHLLELFHGQTGAFKDVGARFLAACLARMRRDDPRPLTILVATSGDTGAAVAAAFHGRPGLRVAVLYPDGRVSPRQAHQLGCFGGNVRAFRVAGNFDDCQAMVKAAFADEGLRGEVPLASANSISLGRLLPQMAYYAQAALEHRGRSGDKLGFVIPTGNLGNAFAGLLARQLGLPVGDVVLATNANRVLPNWFATGDYRPSASVPTLANAMDVGDPSNAERLGWLWPEPEARARATYAVPVEDDRIRQTIRDWDAHWGELLCPHTACAAAHLDDLRAEGDRRPWAVVATAHPAKFETVVEPLVGRTVPLPPTLAAMLERPAHAEPLTNEPAALAERLRSWR